jgi:hypothetical protein
MQTINNLGFLDIEPWWHQCSTCRNRTNSLTSICQAKVKQHIVGQDLKGECSGHRWSFIKWIKRIGRK